MNVMVTGAKGYIGAHVVSYLVNNRHRFLASDIDYISQHPLVTAVETPIFGCGDDIYEVSGKPDALIHLAWRNGFKIRPNTVHFPIGNMTRLLCGGVRKR